MLKNYLYITFRHLLKRKGTSLINITGLGLGLTCLLVIWVVIRYEQSYDQFHSDTDRIYRIIRQSANEANQEFRTGVVFPLPDAVKAGIPSLEKVTSMYFAGGVQVGVYDQKNEKPSDQFNEYGLAYIDPQFFEIFDFKDTDFHWIAGDPASALNEPFELVLTETMAEKYFPEENAIGKTLKLDNQDDFKVSGIISDFPSNTDFPFKIIVSMSTLQKTLGDYESDWVSVSDEYYCYVKLAKNASPAVVDKQIMQVRNAQLDEQALDLLANQEYKLQPLNEVHVDGRFGNYNYRTVGKETIWALVIIGLFLMATVIINFVNLSIAQAITRSKEVGVRKVLGSSRKLLALQFLSENFMLTFTSGLLALGLSELVLYFGSDFLKVNLESPILQDLNIWGALLILILCVTILSGIYPSLVLSGFNPVLALKNKINTTSGKGLRLRWALVAVQFVIAQIFIIGTIVIFQQLELFRNSNLGFKKNDIIILPVFNIPENAFDKLATLKYQLEEQTSIESISYSFTTPSGLNRGTSARDIRLEKNERTNSDPIFEFQPVDHQYFNLYQIDFVAGRNFLPTDSVNGIIINEVLAKNLGFQNPESALGEMIVSGGYRLPIMGVVADFHNKSLKEKIDNMGFIQDPKYFNTINVKLNPSVATINNFQQSLSDIQELWSQTFPDYIFEYQFLNESIAAYYREETRMSQIFQLLAGITIFIGCLGLYGLIAFMAVRRTKEVGIRKVLGASVQQILILFSKEFVMLVMAAFLVAGPVAYFTMRQWLQNYENKIAIKPEFFIVAVAVSMFIALATVSYQSVKAALVNPVKSLKNE